MRKYEKKGKKAMSDNLDDEQKEYLKMKDNKRKKAKCDNFNVDEKRAVEGIREKTEESYM